MRTRILVIASGIAVMALGTAILSSALADETAGGGNERKEPPTPISGHSRLRACAAPGASIPGSKGPLGHLRLSVVKTFPGIRASLSEPGSPLLT
jgi:hypothetical protein